MNKEDKKLQKHLVDEMMKVSKTNPDVMFYMESLMEYCLKIEKEIDKLNNTRVKALEFIYKELIPKNVKWDYDDCIFSDLPVERIKPLVDILELKENK